jgi:hypothetical protein
MEACRFQPLTQLLKSVGTPIVNDPSGSPSSDRALALAIVGLLACYLAAAAFRLPQQGRE